MEKLETLFKLYKNDSITDYVVERELSRYFGDQVSVRLTEDLGVNRGTTFTYFALPEKLVEGYHITYFLDKAAIKVIYTEEELAMITEKLNNKTFSIIRKYNSFLNETKDFAVTYTEALAFLLELYSFYRSEMSIKNGELLPADDEILKYVDKFNTQKAEDIDIECLLQKGYIPPQAISFAKAMSHDIPGSITINFSKEERPSMNIGYNAIKSVCTSTFGEREHKDIDPNYIPSTNQ